MSGPPTSKSMFAFDPGENEGTSVENILLNAEADQKERLSVLVVDDNDTEFRLIKQSLLKIDRYGCDIAHAPSADAAFDLMKSMSFDIVLVDYWLGAETGVGFMQNLGGRRSDSLFILLTGMENSDIQTVALKAGATGVLNKNDVNPRILETTIRYALHTHALEHQLITALAKLESANRARAEFMSRIGANLKVPLDTIVETAQQIVDEGKKISGFESMYSAAESVCEKSRKVHTLISNIIELTLSADTSSPQNFSYVDLNTVVQSAVGLTAPGADAKNQNLVVLGDDRLTIVKGDYARLQQCFVNILLNATRYTPAGGEIIVRMDRQGHRYAVSVADNGIGMSREDVMMALRPMGRSRNVDDGEDPGIGLGLPVVREIVARHGGQLDIESTPGSGTTVTVFLSAQSTHDLADPDSPERLDGYTSSVPRATSTE